MNSYEEPTLKVRVTSNGQIRGTKVQDEQGRDLRYVGSMDFSHEAGRLPTLNLNLWGADVSILGEARFMVAGREIQSITLKDGTVVTAEDLVHGDNSHDMTRLGSESESP